MTMDLRQLHKIFPKEEDCIRLLETEIWGSTPICPYCGASNYSNTTNSKRYHCNGCNSSFSVTAKTIFHRTRCDLRKWFFSIYLFAKPVKKITARELGDLIESTKDTAWLIMKKISSERIRSAVLFSKIIDYIDSKSTNYGKERK